MYFTVFLTAACRTRYLILSCFSRSTLLFPLVLSSLSVRTFGRSTPPVTLSFVCPVSAPASPSLLSAPRPFPGPPGHGARSTGKEPGRRRQRGGPVSVGLFLERALCLTSRHLRFAEHLGSVAHTGPSRGFSPREHVHTGVRRLVRLSLGPRRFAFSRYDIFTALELCSTNSNLFCPSFRAIP